MGCLAALAGVLEAADVDFIAVLKGQCFAQVGPQMIGLYDQDSQNETPLVFEAFAFGAAADSLVSGTVTVPGGGSLALVREDVGSTEWRTEPQAETLLDLNTAQPDGTYTVNLVTKNDYTKNISLSLTGSAYPPVPEISNYAALQAITASSATTVQWSAMGGTSDDFIMCSVHDNDTGDTLFQTGMPGASDALNGTATQVVIPAAALLPGRTYEGEVLFVKMVDSDASYTMAVAGYFKRVNFQIMTNALAGTTAAGLESVSPETYSGDVPRDSAVVFRFNRPMSTSYRSVAWTSNGSSISSSDFTYEWIDGNKALLCRYNSTFAANAEIGWTLTLTGFRDAAGTQLSGSSSGSFNTSGAAPESPPDVAFIHVLKQRGYRQTGTSPVTTGMWGCEAAVEETAFNRVKTATLTAVANGRVATLLEDRWDYAKVIEGTYASQADLDRFAPNGDFTFDFNSLGAGAQTMTLSLGATDAYPDPPTVNNLAELQAINPAAAATITWDALPGWSSVMELDSGMIELEIQNSGGNEVLWVDNADLTSGTQFTIPAGTLWPGRTYRVQLAFIRIKDLEDTPYGAGAGFESVTEFTIKTTGSTVMPALALERIYQNTQLTASGGEPNREYVLETSGDLQRWLPQTSLWLGDFPNQYFDGDSQYLNRRYYRLRDRAANEQVFPNITIQGTVWTDASHTTPVAGATVSTDLDGRTIVTDAAGGFFLETDTRSNFGWSQYTITVTNGGQAKAFGPHYWGDQPREQTYEMN